jgi:succinate dehydrogenase/fumarate reductase cytochrome b subunit
MENIQDVIGLVGTVLGKLVPLIVAFAFLFFIWNAFRYFILGGANPDEQAKAKSLAIWGILAFVVIISLWGMVRIFVDVFNVGDNSPIQPDYVQTKSP